MPPVKFYKPIADAKNYPLPYVDMLPKKLFGYGLSRYKKNDLSHFLNKGTYFSLGRYAIARALREVGATRGAVVLVPSYHCRTLIEPVICLGAKVLFFKVMTDLSPDFDELQGVINKHNGEISALILPHYFGYPQDANRVVHMCRAAGISVIEDCAHSYYGRVEGRNIGSVGDLSVSSPRKFFPVEDGGVLVDNRTSAVKFMDLDGKSFLCELKSLARFLFNFLSAAKSYRKVREQSEYSNSTNYISSDNNDEIESECELKWFDSARMNQSSYWITRLIVKFQPHVSIQRVRRYNYMLWVNVLSDVDGCRPLFPDLPEGVVPYVFPLLIDVQPQRVFHAFKLAGVPLWRWEDIAVTHCEVSRLYRYSLFQLPCHQNMLPDDIKYLASSIRKIMLTVSRESNS